MAQLAPWLWQQFLDDNGDPYAGAKVFFYEASTSTKKDTYTDGTLLVANANPMTLAANGRPDGVDIFFGSGAYKCVIAAGVDGSGDPTGVYKTIDDIDVTSNSKTLSTISALRLQTSGATEYITVTGYYPNDDNIEPRLYRWDADSTATDNGGTVIAPTGNPATGRYLLQYGSKLNIKWFGGYDDGTNAAANDTAISAIDAVLIADGGGEIEFTDGSYLISTNYAFDSSVSLTMKTGAIISAGSAVTLTAYKLDLSFDQHFGSNITVTYEEGSTPLVYPEWYGAIADSTVGGSGGTDSTTGIQSAITQARTAGIKVFFSSGFYRIESALTITGAGNPVTLEGQGKSSCTIVAGTGTSIAAMFTFTADKNDSIRSEISNITFNGNSLAQYGVKGDTGNLTMRTVKIQDTTVAGIDIEGDSNYFEDIEFRSNNGDGLYLSGADGNNAVNVIGCKFADNTGIGLYAINGTGLNIKGCIFERNFEAGIFLGPNLNAYSIDCCYFESNGGTGHSFTSPEALTLKAEIIVNGASDESTISSAFSCNGSVTNCTVNLGSSTYFLWAPAQSQTTMFGNILEAGTKTLFGTYGNNSTTSPLNSYSIISNIDLGANVGWTANFDVDPLDYDILTILGNNIRSNDAASRNLMTSMDNWSLISADGGGTWKRSTEQHPYNEFAEVYELALATTSASDTYGFQIDAADYSVYHNKFFVWGCWMKHTDDATNAITGQITMNPQGTNRQITMDYGTGVGWQLVQGVFKFPTTGTISFTVKKQVQAGGLAGTVYIASPVVHELGADQKALMGVTGNSNQLRSLRVKIENATTAGNYVKATGTGIYKEANIAAEDDLLLNVTGNRFFYGSGSNSNYLWVLKDSLNFAPVGAISAIIEQNFSGTDITVLPSNTDSDYIKLEFYNSTTGAAVDLDLLVDTGDIQVLVSYIT
jgi:hypothetical protein